MGACAACRLASILLAANAGTIGAKTMLIANKYRNNNAAVFSDI